MTSLIFIVHHLGHLFQYEFLVSHVSLWDFQIKFVLMQTTIIFCHFFPLPEWLTRPEYLYIFIITKQCHKCMIMVIAHQFYQKQWSAQTIDWIGLPYAWIIWYWWSALEVTHYSSGYAHDVVSSCPAVRLFLRWVGQSANKY